MDTMSTIRRTILGVNHGLQESSTKMTFPGDDFIQLSNLDEGTAPILEDQSSSLMESSVEDSLMSTNQMLNFVEDDEEEGDDDNDHFLDGNSEVLQKVAQIFSKFGARTGGETEAVKPNTIKMRENIDMSKFEKAPVEEYGINVRQLKKWSVLRMQKLLEQEASQQEVALSKVRGFMEAMTKLTKIQSWWRMMGWKKTFNTYRQGRRQIKKEFFGAWKRHMLSEKMFLNQVIGKPFKAWAAEVDETKRLNHLIGVFFNTCIKRLKLTPQAVMAFFSPENFGGQLSESDMTKIRRLILSKLWNGWCSEVRIAKTFRYRASLILSRMMRKTKGPMWSKEMTLLYFHMWRRYIAVRLAYRRGEPDPIFKIPYIHQWTIYLQQLTMSRIYKRRAIENGRLLIQLRTWRRWKFMMTDDRSKPKDPLAMARMHYRQRFCTILFKAWYGLVREKGRIMRLRERTFIAWKNWAPRKRKLSRIKRVAMEMWREKSLVHVFDTMTSLCKDSLGRRANTLKKLSQSMYNRKLLLCAHALANRLPNVLMIDCWRRWSAWSKSRKKFKSLLWQFRYSYHDCKTRIIFSAWRDWVRFRVSKLVGDSAQPMKGLLSGDDDNDSIDREYLQLLQFTPRDKSQLLSSLPSDADQNASGRSPLRSKAPPSQSPSFNSASFSGDMNLNGTGKSPVGFTPANSFLSEDGNGLLESTDMIVSSVQYPTCLQGSMQATMEIVYNARSASTPISANSNAFYLFCSAYSRASVLEINNTRAAMEAASLVDVTDASSSTSSDSTRVQLVKQRELQTKLQDAVNALSLEEVTVLVEDGAIVYRSQIDYVAKFLGDETVPLYCFLISCCPMYITQRVAWKDRERVLMDIASPLSAVLLSSQVERWERRELTSRENATLIENKSAGIANIVGTNFQSVLLWRAVLLNLLKVRSDDLAARCVLLPPTRTVDEEVVEVLKRQKISRLIAIRESLASVMGIERDSWSLGPSTVVPPLIYTEPPRKKGQSSLTSRPPTLQITEDAFGNVRAMNIYELLSQYTTITGKLTSEARAIRNPMLIRDDRLNRNGFMRQARADFLELRKLCLTPAQIKELEMKSREKELSVMAKQERVFAAKEAARKKQQALDLAEKRKLQKELAHKAALGILPTKSDQEDGDNQQASDEPPQEEVGTRSRAVSKSADSQPRKSRSISADKKGSKSRQSQSPASRVVATKKEPRATAVLVQRKFNFDSDDESETSTGTNTPRDQVSGGAKANPLRALFTKDPTKSVKQLQQEAALSSKQSAKVRAPSKFLYDGQKFVLTREEEEEQRRLEGMSGGAEAALKGVKEDHIKALLKVATSTSIGAKARAKTILQEDPDDDASRGSTRSDDSSTLVSNAASVNSVESKDAVVQAMKEAAMKNAAAKLAKKRDELGDDWEAGQEDEDEDDDENGDNEERSPPAKDTEDKKGGKAGKAGAKANAKEVDGEDEEDEDEEDGDDDDNDGDGDGDGDDAENNADENAVEDVDAEVEVAPPPPKAKASKAEKGAKGKSGKGGGKSVKGGAKGKASKSGKNSIAAQTSTKGTGIKLMKEHKVASLSDRNIRNEEFAERTLSFQNLLTESWFCRAKRQHAAVRSSLAKRNSDLSKFICESLLPKFLANGGMEQPSKTPEPAAGGLSGWILKKALSDISFITAPVWVLFIPSDWWKVPCVYERLEKEKTLVQALSAAAKVRIQAIESKDLLIQEQQKDCMNYLKNARKEVAAIGAKRYQLSQEDLGQSLAMKRIITKTKAAVAKAVRNLADFQETIKRAEALLTNGNFDEIFEIFGEGSGYNDNIVDAEKIGQRAIAVVEKQYTQIPRLQTRIVDLEGHVRKAEGDVRAFERSSARVQEMLRRFGEGRFNVVVDVQQIINSIMPQRQRFDSEIELELKKLQTIQEYKKKISKLSKKVYEKGDVLQNELLALASDEDVYVVMYRFQMQQIEAKRKLEALELEQLDSPLMAARQEAVYSQMFGADELVEEDGDAFDDISVGSHESYSNTLSKFGPPGTGGVPPPHFDGQTPLGTSRLSTRQNSIAGNEGVGSFSRLASSSGFGAAPLLSSASDLVDNNNLTTEMRAKLNLSGKSRRQKMKAMEDHLKEVADQIAMEQAKEDLRARTFDEYWICIGPVDKKKPKKSKSSGKSGKSPTANGDATARSTMTSPTSAPGSPGPLSPMADTLKEQSFFDAFLKPIEVAKLSLTEKLWKSTSSGKTFKSKKPTKKRFGNYDDIDQYDDISFDDSTTTAGRKSDFEDDLEDVDNQLYVYDNPLMWSAKGQPSISMNRADQTASFEDPVSGSKSQKRRGVRAKNAPQDSFATAGAAELTHLRATRNRIDRNDNAAELSSNPFADEDDETNSDNGSINSKASKKAASLSARSAAAAASLDAVVASLDVVQAITLPTDEEPMDDSRPPSGEPNTEPQNPPPSTQHQTSKGAKANFDLDDESLAKLKRTPPNITFVRRTSLASVAPNVDTLREDDEDDEDDDGSPTYIAGTTNLTHQHQVETYMAMVDDDSVPLKPSEIIAEELRSANSGSSRGPKIPEKKQTLKVRFGVDDQASSESDKPPSEHHMGTIPLGHSGLDSAPLGCQVPDGDDDMSEITVDAEVSSLPDGLTRTSVPEIINLLNSNADPNLKDDDPASARSDITDSDNEKEESTLRAPIVVLQAAPVRLSMEAAEFRDDAKSVPRSHIKSIGPSSNAYNEDDVQDGADIEMMKVPAMTALRSPPRDLRPDSREEGIAVLEGGQWRISAPSSRPSSSPIRGSFIKETKAASKGILNPFQDHPIDPLKCIHISTFEPLKMPDPPPAVDLQRVLNATKPIRSAEGKALPLEANSKRPKSPVHDAVTESLKVAQKHTSKHQQKSNLELIRAQEIADLKLEGKPVLVVPVVNLLQDDEYLLSDHQLTQEDERPDSVRLGDSLGLDDSVLEAIKFDHSLNALTLADEPVSLVDLVESGFGHTPVAKAPVKPPRNPVGILTSRSGKVDTDIPTSPNHRSRSNTSAKISELMSNFDDDCNEESPGSGDFGSDAFGDVLPTFSPEGRRETFSTKESDSRRSSRSLKVEPDPRFSPPAAVGKSSKLLVVTGKSDSSRKLDNDQLTRSDSQSSSVRDSQGSGSADDSFRAAYLKGVDARPASSPVDVSETSAASVPRATDSWPSNSESLRVSTPILSFISTAVRKTVEERESPQRMHEPPNFLETITNRAATIVALQESLKTKLPMKDYRQQSNLERRMDRVALATGLMGTQVGPPVQFHEEVVPLVAHRARDSRPKRDFGPDTVKDSLVVGRGFAVDGAAPLDHPSPIRAIMSVPSLDSASVVSARSNSSLLSGIHSARIHSARNPGIDEESLLVDEPDNMSESRSHPYARQPDHFETIGSTKAEFHKEAQSKFLRGAETDAVMEAYATILGIPDALLVKKQGFTISAAIQSAGGGIVCHSPLPNGETDWNDSMNLSVSSPSSLVMNATVPFVDPPAPTDEGRLTPRTVFPNPYSSPITDSLQLSPSRASLPTVDDDTIASELFSPGSEVDLRESLLNSMNSLGTSSAPRFVSVKDFLKSRGRSAGQDLGAVSRGSTSHAALPFPRMDVTGPRAGAAAADDSDDLEADLERELRSILDHQKHGRSNLVQPASNTIQSSHAQSVKESRNDLKLPNISKSVFIPKKSIQEVETEAKLAKAEQLRKNQVHAMLIKQDPQMEMSGAIVDNPRNKKMMLKQSLSTSSLPSKRSAAGMPQSVVSQFGDGLTGTFALKAKPKTQKPKLKSFLKEKGKGRTEEDADDDDDTVITNITNLSASAASARSDLSKASGNVGGTLIISLTQPKGDGDSADTGGPKKSKSSLAALAGDAGAFSFGFPSNNSASDLDMLPLSDKSSDSFSLPKIKQPSQSR